MRSIPDRCERGLNRPFPAYRGSDAYVFVCYAHSDAGTVYADLVELDSNGVNIWYDEGIPAGSSWRGEVSKFSCSSVPTS